MQDWTTDQRRFQAWLATPSKEREIKTQKGFAEQLGVAPETLSRWKSRPGFMDSVDDLRMRYIDNNLTELYGAAVKHAKNGDHRYFQTLIELHKDAFNKQQVDVNHSSEGEKDEMTQEGIAERIVGIIKKGDPDDELNTDEFLSALTGGTQAPQAEA